MRRAFLVPSVVLWLCTGLSGCGGDRTHQTKPEDVADSEELFQSAAQINTHRASARQAVRTFIEKRFPDYKVYGLHSVPSEGGTYRVAADVEIGQTREILKFEAIRFFPDKRAQEAKAGEPYWEVVILSASREKVLGDSTHLQTLRNSNAPTAETPPAASGAEPLPADSVQP